MNEAKSAKQILEPDCTKCAALCCVALHIEKSTKFAIDKPAGIQCPNLSLVGRCNIHNRLKKEGFGGCVAYDCLGAGQRVVQDLFDGKSWQEAPTLLQKMSDDFAKMRKIHELLGVLSTAENLKLAAHQEAMRQDLVTEMSPPKWLETREF